jgi:hypothetical protein
LRGGWCSIRLTERREAIFFGAVVQLTQATDARVQPERPTNKETKHTTFATSHKTTNKTLHRSAEPGSAINAGYLSLIMGALCMLPVSRTAIEENSVLIKFSDIFTGSISLFFDHQIWRRMDCELGVSIIQHDTTDAPHAYATHINCSRYPPVKVATDTFVCKT